MHPILAAFSLAEVSVILFSIFAMLCTGVAFVAIVPAALGRLRLAIFMTAPAFICCFLNIVVISYFLFWGPDAPPRDKLRVFWDANDTTFELICFSAVPLLLSFFVPILGLICSRIRKPVVK
jgi:hypothetical protein